MKNAAELFMNIAAELAKRSTCARLSVGCVITTLDDYVVAMGYNGSPPGDIHCSTWNVNHETPCNCVHAEQNAVVRCSESWRTPKRAYVTTFPCYECTKLLISISVVEIIYASDYRDMTRSMEMIERLKIKTRKYVADSEEQ